jgi:hypothetical protein
MMVLSKVLMEVFMRGLFLLFVVLTGCSTVPQPILPITGSVIVINRDTGLLGSGCVYQVSVNGTKVGLLNSGGRLVVPAMLGENNVRMETDQTGLVSTLCANVRMARSVTMDGRPRFFRVGMSYQQIFFEEDTQ